MPITPNQGSTGGGTAVTSTGTQLTTTQAVSFGGGPASFDVIGDTIIAAVTPPGAAGTVDGVVATTGGAATAAGAFTYTAGPGI
ncbi:IPT/TIG domain-containing protein [Streptomyces sp. NPDC021749]|uniref:IPT/TIG domain-containing protein n=1 Tax=Streptomyces sp. NPDC021749 TaxID=3154905 RepID=UPI00340BBA12